MAGNLGEKAAEKPEKIEVISAGMIVDKGMVVQLAEKCLAFFMAFSWKSSWLAAGSWLGILAGRLRKNPKRLSCSFSDFFSESTIVVDRQASRWIMRNSS
ncbi:hypothetical protein [Persicirhabdus sediminis]|uniref:hypothetical protein n=1 Tax=Persicirhabdus sediminis TaxID=454144 RepID=UPI001F29107F|nr:hypothetical protein [Persicirhabdus sediminis]